MKTVKEWIVEIRNQADSLKNPDPLALQNLKFMGWGLEHLYFAANHLENFARAMEKDIK